MTKLQKTNLYQNYRSFSKVRFQKNSNRNNSVFFSKWILSKNSFISNMEFSLKFFTENSQYVCWFKNNFFRRSSSTYNRIFKKKSLPKLQMIFKSSFLKTFGSELQCVFKKMNFIEKYFYLKYWVFIKIFIAKK